MKQVKIALAPMAGVTDSPFRVMNKLGGADYTYSEMIHARALTEKNSKTAKMIQALILNGFYFTVQMFFV